MIWAISILVEENLFVAQVKYCTYSYNALYMLTSTVTMSIHDELLLQFWFIIYDDDLHCLYKVITLIYLIINALFIMFNNIYAYMSISTTITIHLSLAMSISIIISSCPSPSRNVNYHLSRYVYIYIYQLKACHQLVRQGRVKLNSTDQEKMHEHRKEQHQQVNRLESNFSELTVIVNYILTIIIMMMMMIMMICILLKTRMLTK